MVILPVRNCPCDPSILLAGTKKPRDFPLESGYYRAAPLQEQIVCRHPKVGRIASINLGTSTLATQRMHCDYQLWMHLLTLSPHPRPLIGQLPLTQRLFSAPLDAKPSFPATLFAATQLSFPAPRLTAAPGRALGPEGAFLGAS